MPEFKTEKALTLSARRLGERAWVMALLTRENGRLLGVYQKKQPPEIGCFVSARWQARLSEQLGRFYLEETTAFSAQYLDDTKRLAAISSVCALLDMFLPERQAFPDLYDTVMRFFQSLDKDDFLRRYVLFEYELLAEIGFGLDLTRCAGGGNSQDLAYVSPKTGKAVSREKGKPYHNRLLILPQFMWKEATAEKNDIRNGLILTGYFLAQHAPRNQLPYIREQLFDLK